MTVQNFIPTIWSARFNENFKKNLVFGNVVNTDYEGEIANQGDTVKINSLGDITIGKYDKVNGVGDPEELSSTQQSLTVDQADFFNFAVHDVDKAQANTALIDQAMTNASYGMASVIDNYIASLYTEAQHTIGDDAEPVTVTKADAYDYIVDLGTLLSEASVPKNDRFVIVPEAFASLLNKDDRFTRDPNVLANGYNGTVNGMQVYASNNAPQVTGDGTATFNNTKVIAGHRSAISFAQQISSVEAYRPEKGFSDATKGLQLYGAKVVKPEALAVLSVAK